MDNYDTLYKAKYISPLWNTKTIGNVVLKEDTVEITVIGCGYYYIRPEGATGQGCKVLRKYIKKVTT